VSVIITDSNASSPAGAVDSASTETDAFPLQTMTTVTDAIMQNTGTAVLLYSTSSTDGLDNTIATNYTNPQQLDKLPEAQGNSWAPNNPAATVTETLADGLHISRNVAADGSYGETDAAVNGVSSSITVNGAANAKPLDGSGAYDVVGLTTFSYAAPSAGSITLSIMSGGTTVKTRTFPAWYTISGSLINDTFSDNGIKPFDPSCSVPAAIGSAGEQVVETYSVLDPVLGYTDTRVTTSYDVSGFGQACVTITDTMKSYYDYTNDTTKVDYQSQNGLPNRIDTIVESLSMTSPTTPYSGARRAESARPVSPALVVARESAITHRRELQRLNTLRALRAFAERFASKGVVR
jgi:hypothetical protein